MGRKFFERMRAALFFLVLLAVAMAEDQIYAVELEPGQDAKSVAEANGFELVGQIGSLANMYRFKPVLGGPQATRSVEDRSVSLRANPAVVYVEKQVLKQQGKREEDPTM